MTGGTWFPFHYRDVAGWKSDLGLVLSTTSDEAARYLDATVAQTALMDIDHQVGGVEEAAKKMLEADPEFVMGHVYKLFAEVSAPNNKAVYKNPELKKKIFDLQEKCKKKNLPKWEMDHVQALAYKFENNENAACNIWESILTDHPGDMLAAHWTFFSQLNSGNKRGIRDSMYRLAVNTKASNRYYGNVQGKLCFGFEEMGQFSRAEAAGMLALDHSPKDIWAIHAMAHVHEETSRPCEGLEFLSRVEPNWVENSSMRGHVWWHRCLHYVQLGEYEEALTQLDDVLMPWARKGPFPFPLSDCTSLLLRLQMLNEKVGDLSDRWRELGQLYLEYAGGLNSVFFDLHTVIGLCFGGEPTAAGKIANTIQEQARMHREDSTPSHNHRSAYVCGVPMTKSILAFANGDYDAALEHGVPVRYQLRDLFDSSHAQQDIMDLMLTIAAIRSGRQGLAKGLLDERMARACETTESGPLLNDRLLERVTKMQQEKGYFTL